MAQAKGRRDGIASSNENARPVSGEGGAWQGPRTVLLQKNSQGFGFTLRHFIVYPPESALKDEENGNGKGCPRARLEPMDTIFVKNVREKGPAHQAGLCTGDRLVKVNGESVLGKTYSQVIALIQDSESVLELSIMPKDEDVLQLAYSQEAYLRGNEPYTRGAQSLPEPPPACYPRGKPPPAVPGPGLGPPDNLNQRRTPSPDNRSAAPSGGEGGGGHSRARSASAAGLAVSPLDFHFANHGAAIASASLPPPRKGSLPAARGELCHRALTDWYHSQAAELLGPPARHGGASPDRLAELGLAPAERRVASPDALLLLHLGAPRGDGFWPGGWGAAPPSGRSCSESLLAAYAAYESSYGRSLETLGQAAALVSPRRERAPAWPPHAATVPPPGRAGPTAQAADDQAAGYRSYSPSFCRRAGHLMRQSHSFRDASHAGPDLGWTPTPETSPPDSAASSSGPREPSPPPPPPPAAADSRAGGSVEEECVQAQTQEVVLRQKPPAGRRAPHATRHTHYTLPADAGEPPPDPAPPRRPNGSLLPPPAEQDSLASIPFIDEPTSPGVDLRARHVPASSVVSGGLCPAPGPTASPASPTLTFPLTRLFSTDCSNVKNSRRSSYLLAITTERSKSCDEGLNAFREEGRVFSRLPKRVKSFFTDGSLESLRAAEDARSKRHSTSELGSITLSDVRKEGWLHYKQILTEKGKKVGGGMRPWKRVFSVLRSHSLFLYKDKREAVLHGAGAGGHGGEDEQPISVRGCLVDIAYSETKRKHTLRLTTQDFCEYLLQAEDREDMLGWIRVIRENSKTDSEELGFSRQALINKKLNDYRKQSPTGSKPDASPRVHRMMPPFLLSKTENTSGATRSSKSEGKDESSPPKATWGINIMKKGKKPGPKVFGVRLEDCQPGADNKFVPLIVEICCGLVEEMGLEYTGIYRVPGNNAMVSSLQDQLNKGMDINTAEEKWQDLNVISSLLKSFFRKLPEPLFTDDKYNDFIDANRLEDAGDRLKTMKKLIRDLPDHYYHTLKFLVGHLKTVADNSDKNKMEPRNLALVFGPTLVRSSEDNMTDMVTHMPDRYKIVETLVLHHGWFFSEELDKDEKTPEDQRDLQPVPNIDHLLSNIGRTAPLGDASDSTNSDSVKSKGSSGSKKDLSAKDFLPLSIISAVTRKRKKRQGACPRGSSTDEDSEHEPIKASNYGEAGGAEGEGGEGRTPPGSGGGAEEGGGEGGRGFLIRPREEGGAREGEGPAGAEGGVRARQGPGDAPATPPGRSGPPAPGEGAARGAGESGPASRPAPRAPSGAPQRPRSFLYAHHQPAAGARASPVSSTPGPGPCRPAQGDPLTRKKPRGDRARPHSMHLEPSAAPVPAGGDPPLPRAARDDPWGAGGPRRPASPETRRRRRDWRRHTVVVNLSGEG